MDMVQEEKIYGLIFLLLKKFVENNFGHGTWIKMARVAGAPLGYQRRTNYPISEMHSIIKDLANLMGLSENDVTERFGEFLASDLLLTYKSFINRSWKTYELLANTEMVMHKAVRRKESLASPPILNISRVHAKLLIIDYYSERKMASLAIGIIKGIAAYYHESEKVHINPTTNPNDARVQIRVEFD